ncbi:hypothetical protein F5141DRAFT_1258101 [Pisolithus sp. B1]|nr:hypothetical protein F5141DRAFT_1258101 [Pisolithus sp. B1]
MTVSLWAVRSPVSIVVRCLCERIDELRDSLVLFYRSRGILARMEDREDRIIDPCGVLTCRQLRCFLRVFQPRYRTSHNSIWKIVLELEVVEPRTMVMKTHTVLIPGGSGKEYAEKKPKAQVTKPFLGSRRRPTADNSAVLEACVHAVGDDEHGTHSSRNVGVTRYDSRHVTDTGRAEKNRMLNGPAIVEICVLAVGNDEHKGVLAVTDDVGSFARGAATVFSATMLGVLYVGDGVMPGLRQVAPGTLSAKYSNVGNVGLPVRSLQMQQETWCQIVIWRIVYTGLWCSCSSQGSYFGRT